MELESLEEMTFGVSQLAALPGVTASYDTVLRTMRRLVEVSPDAADLVEAGCRGRGRQSVWRIRRPRVTWSTSRREGLKRRQAFRTRLQNPQSASLPSRKKKSTSSETTPIPPPKPERQVDVAREEGLQEDQKRLLEALQAQEGPNLNPGGAKAAAAAVTPLEARQLVEAGREFMKVLFEEIRPQAIKSPQALLVARLKSPSFRRDILSSAQAYIRRRDAAVAAGDVAGLKHEDLTPAAALAALKAAASKVPSQDAPGYLDAYDRERAAWKVCLDVARREDPAKAARIEAAARESLEVKGLKEGSLIWNRAFAHQVAKDLAEATPWLQQAQLVRSR